MTQRIHARVLLMGLSVLAVATAPARSQNAPLYDPPVTTTGFQLPRVGGTLRYSLNASESISPRSDTAAGTSYSTNLSGNVAYLSESSKAPFSMVYSGGYLNSNTSERSSPFHTLSLSQVMTLKRWSFVVLDTVSYLPEAAVSGLSGVPGLGDLGLGLGQGSLFGTNDSTGLQSNYGNRITNAVSGTASRSLTGRTSVSGSGNMQILRFPGQDNSAGLENDQKGASASLSHQFSHRTSMSVNYAYSRFQYPFYDITYNSHSGTLGLSQSLTSKLGVDVSIGPEFSTTPGTPGTLNYTFNASATYNNPRTNLVAGFTRASNAGQGVTLATRSNIARLSATHKLGTYSSGSVFASFGVSNSLPSSVGYQSDTNTFISGLQGSRAVSRTLSAYASYTLQHQTMDTNTFAFNSLNGFVHTVGFGVTYTPRALILSRH